MSTLSKPLWRRPKAAILAKRDKFGDDLNDVYNNILDTTDPYLDPDSYENFKIACHHLYIYRGRDGREHASCERYFTPMSVNELRSYPIDKDDEDTIEYLELEPLLWETHKILGDEPMDAARKINDAYKLTSDDYRDHTVIPVLALSYMGDKQARLLHAYFGDKGLVTYKSHLLSFQNPEDSEKSIEFLLQFMTGKLVGSTAVV
ncbi:hypothetical protein CNMCM6106_004035 [Aspergillus hiratsukae]|uniref:Uncharacterized protein n=1 Tax=Aspergillus hiratsukae TaxID=1194566 RepID=A0A8H6UVY7_9EURO|nr:hypothetical protein CNMCM6106_004035 [Aspergillus hiratsukae]